MTRRIQRKRLFMRPRSSCFPNIHGRPDGKNQEERNMRKKFKQANSHNLGKTKLSSCKLFTIAKKLLTANNNCKKSYLL
jgi:hypothetical protein